MTGYRLFSMWKIPARAGTTLARRRACGHRQEDPRAGGDDRDISPVRL